MFRSRIILDGRSETPAILTALQSQCAAAGLSMNQAEAVIAQVREPLGTLIENGRAVSSASGQFRASRRIVTDAAEITLDAQFGVPPGLFARLRRALSLGG